jgi:hypothetical protein
MTKFKFFKSFLFHSQKIQILCRLVSGLLYIISRDKKTLTQSICKNLRNHAFSNESENESLKTRENVQKEAKKILRIEKKKYFFFFSNQRIFLM